LQENLDLADTRYIQVAFDLPLNLTFTYSLNQENPLPPLGARVLVPFGSGQKKGFVVESPSLSPSTERTIKVVSKIVDKESLFGPWTLDLARWLSSHYLCSLGQAIATLLPSAKREKNLDFFEIPQAADHDLSLNAEQQEALKAILSEEKKPVYLWGLTGTGKTEVFLQAARNVLNSGRQVLYLVPEIALTWPLISTLIKRFGDRVAVLHSHLTASQKLGEWTRIRDGKADLVVGARSAVFAPLRNPGLFIVDEEHETSYKSGQTPRYHARQVVFHLANITGAKVVMGSATPSLESVWAMKAGIFRQLRLTSRPAGGAMPEVHLVNMAGSKGIFSSELIEAIHQTHTQGRQTILFLNRRGFGASFFCRTCGENLLCQNCSVALTWHKSRNILLCHFCGWQTKPVTSCPNCGSLDVGWSSIGTERVEEELTSLFPNLRIARLDSDTTGQHDHTPHVLSAFRNRELDLLLGTQMVAKGLDFPEVKLVGILNADMGLSIPDFRSAERVYALVRQVAGRAGRFHPDGLVLVQTLRPRSNVLVKAAQGLDEEFWDEELAIRKELGFPPFVRLARILIRSAWPDNAKESAQNLVKELRIQPSLDDAEILGPSECAVAVQAGQHRFQILLRASQFAPLHHALSQVLSVFRPPKDVRIEIDFDPIHLM
jgi:primosomal protein N' (replication factor Y)